jgi:hypothetical protein
MQQAKAERDETSMFALLHESVSWMRLADNEELLAKNLKS